MGMRRTGPAFAIVMLLTVSACAGGGGSSGPSPTPSGGGGVGPSGTPAAPTSGAPSGPAASDGGAGSSGKLQVPADACSVVSDADIKDLFGGEVEPVPNDDPGDCSFSVTKANGLLKDYAATIPQIVGVTFDNGYIGYDEEHQVMGDAVARVDGLGREAWLGLGAIHVDLGNENELVVTTVFGEIYDLTVIAGERFSLAKLVLSRL